MLAVAALSSHVGVLYDFGQVGGNDGHAGVIHKFSRFAGGITPQTCDQMGGSVRPLVRGGPVSPNVLEKKKRCACLARAGTLLARQN